jgi:glycosyltransferase involved in cell wall biosynthesis
MALKHLVIRQRILEREVRGLRDDLGGAEAADRIERLGPSLPAPRVSVVLPLFNFADYVAGALRSVAVSDLRAVEVVVVDDASTDGSAEVVRETSAALPWLPVTLVLRGRNGGLAAARNLGTELARAEYVFMLDADNEVHPRGLRRLAEALDAAPTAAFAYGVIEAHAADDPRGIVSWLGWDAERLRYGNWIDAMAMLRRSALLEVGGYTGEPSLYGWEDFALWCALAGAGRGGVHVPEFVARYRSNPHSMIALTTIDVSEAWATLLRRYPFLGREAAGDDEGALAAGAPLGGA